MAIGTPTSIGSITGSGTATQALTTTGDAATTDTILLMCGARDCQIASVADSAGNTYVIDIQAQNGTATAAIVRSRPTTLLPSGGTITVTYTVTGLYYAIGAVVVSGLDSSPLDKTNSTGAFGATSWTSGSTATTTVANELIFGMNTAGFTITSSTPDAGQTELFDFVSSSNTYVCNYQIVSATGAYAVSGTWASAPTEQEAIVATYKAAPVFDANPISDAHAGRFGPY